MRRFGLKPAVDFAHFGLKSGVVYEGATMVYEHIYISIGSIKIRNKLVVCECEINLNLRNLFIGVLIISF